MAVPGPLALTPEISAFREAFEQISADADAFASSLTDDQFRWEPTPNAWSVARCFEHLNMTARRYLPMLDEGIASAIRRGLYGPGPFSYNWIGRLAAYFVDAATRFHAEAPTASEPAESRSRQSIMAAFRAYQVQYVDRLRQANGLDLAKARVPLLSARWVRTPLGSAFVMTVAHERRHLAQARRVTDAPGFPAR